MESHFSIVPNSPRRGVSDSFGKGRRANAATRALLFGALALPGCAAPAQHSSPSADQPSDERMSSDDLILRSTQAGLAEMEGLPDPKLRLLRLTWIESDLSNVPSSNPKKVQLYRQIQAHMDAALEEIRLSRGGRKKPPEGTDKEGRPYEQIVRFRMVNGIVSVFDLQRDEEGIFFNGKPISEAEFVQYKKSISK